MRSPDFGGHPLLHHYNFLMSQRRQAELQREAEHERLAREAQRQNEARFYYSKEGKMELVITLLLLIIVLDIVALRWGHDSRDSLDSAEWERRKRWYLLTPAHHD